MPKVTYVSFDGESQTVDVAVGENVMRGALYNGIEGIAGECGGACSCATCHVFIDADWASKVGGPSSEAEAELLEATSVEANATSRLCCQVIMSDELDGLVVHMPETQF
ncbi:2Fe-2S iron-sulfur cluster-binding protein [Novosphingobium sp. TH158]|uniref:2Fe-2S iron-sulfur cluster-binding protein n=1 Tax=Novosphingobium sp. TH158 TaxID=2067455 RepID=UPI000C7DA00A|nr:2Fe-2S iron-sulfur cluster-binding protein [Novosphingobium sp. TH158]PLK27615.1 (2Fe-2S)-binding protein [Novosphingobium sp. TH158]